MSDAAKRLAPWADSPASRASPSWLRSRKMLIARRVLSPSPTITSPPRRTARDAGLASPGVAAALVASNHGATSEASITPSPLASRTTQITSLSRSTRRNRGGCCCAPAVAGASSSGAHPAAARAAAKAGEMEKLGNLEPAGVMGGITGTFLPGNSRGGLAATPR